MFLLLGLYIVLCNLKITFWDRITWSFKYTVINIKFKLQESSFCRLLYLWNSTAWKQYFWYYVYVLLLSSNVCLNLIEVTVKNDILFVVNPVHLFRHTFYTLIRCRSLYRYTFANLVSECRSKIRLIQKKVCTHNYWKKLRLFVCRLYFLYVV